MTGEDWDDLLEEEIIQEIENCWHDVFKASKKIVNDAKVFSFKTIEDNASPNIHQILDSLKIIDLEISLIWDKHFEGELQIDDTRLIHNTMQQILNMKNGICIKK